MREKESGVEKRSGSFFKARLPRDEKAFCRWARNSGLKESGRVMVGVKREERFLSAQADAFARANAEEKIGLLHSK
jgi:hypothetical protein